MISFLVFAQFFVQSYAWFFFSSPSESLSLARQGAPFEMTSTDEEFLKNAVENGQVGNMDLCYHMVIASLKSKCGEMGEEQLGRLSVQLLNCQLQSEERSTYPCGYDMSLAECTQNMDGTTWNAYQIVSNRARAMCYQTRQQHFRIKTEQTVNKLAASAVENIEKLDKIKSSQQGLYDVTLNMLDKVTMGQKNFIEKQEFLVNTQASLHTKITSNVRSLLKEKQIIASGNKELFDITSQIHEKLDATTVKLGDHESILTKNHKDLLHDLSTIETRAKQVIAKISAIELTSKEAAEFHLKTTTNFQQTLGQLTVVNDSLSYILAILNDLHGSVDQKLSWITHYVGGTNDNIYIIVVLLMHFVFAVLSACACSFLGTPFFSRFCLILLVLLNVWMELTHHTSFNFYVLSFLIAAITLVDWMFIKSARDKLACSASQHTAVSEVEKLLLSRTIQSSPEFQKLVSALNQLCPQGNLAASDSNNLPPEKIASNSLHCGDDCSHRMDNDQSYSLAATLNLGWEDNKQVTPHLITKLPEMPRANVIPAHVNRDQVDQVKRKLLKSPSVPSDSAESLARKGIERLANRSNCSSMTRGGTFCKLPVSANSDFCYRHMTSPTSNRC